MPRSFVRPSAVLSALPVTHYSTMDRTTQRQTHDVLRHSVERLWHPFTAGRHGADLKAYRFQENLMELCTPGNTFTCQVNGLPGGKRVLEDFFATLITGFDIVHVNVESARGSSLAEPRDVRNYRGYYALEHTRPFLGWKPSPTSLRLPAGHASPNAVGVAYDRGDGAGEAAEHFYPTGCEAEAAAMRMPMSSSLMVPFTTYVEGVMGNGRLSHLVLRSPVLELLSSCVECPEEVRRCLLNKEALKMLATLRRAGVKPEMITAKTLLSASKQNEMWSQALGIL
ncbi:hypothetical protein NQL31_000297 [Lotmaria passim]